MVAIVLVGPGDAIGHAIDRATGRRGISHCCVELDWPHVGDPWLVEISREHGVEIQRWSTVVLERHHERIELTSECGAFLLAQLQRRLGEPYHFKAMLLQPLQIAALTGTYCSTVVADCLPAHLRSLLPRLPAPADLRALRGMRGTR